MKKNLLLLVEDNPLLLGLYKAAFTEKGIGILTAHEGEKALDMAKSSKPDLIILDLLMIGMDGFQVLEALKKNHETQSIKVVILTAISDQKSKDRAIALGAEDYLVKSELRIDDIVKVITSHL